MLRQLVFDEADVEEMVGAPPSVPSRSSPPARPVRRFRCGQPRWRRRAVPRGVVTVSKPTWSARGVSLRNRVGEQVASPLVTLIDDGTMAGEWGYFAIDDEAVLPVTTSDSGRCAHRLHVGPAPGS